MSVGLLLQMWTQSTRISWPRPSGPTESIAPRRNGSRNHNNPRRERQIRMPLMPRILDLNQKGQPAQANGIGSAWLYRSQMDWRPNWSTCRQTPCVTPKRVDPIPPLAGAQSALDYSLKDIMWTSQEMLLSQSGVGLLVSGATDQHPVLLLCLAQCMLSGLWAEQIICLWKGKEKSGPLLMCGVAINPI